MTTCRERLLFVGRRDLVFTKFKQNKHIRSTLRYCLYISRVVRRTSQLHYCTVTTLYTSIESFSETIYVANLGDVRRRKEIVMSQTK
jgi:hypothetical protein